MVDTVIKKRKVSKKTKKSWRKNVDTKDVDAYLDNVRLEERLGAPYSERKDEELFAVDKTRDDSQAQETSILTKKQRRELLKTTEPRCFAILKPITAVPDPIGKRNRVRTPEERKSSILKRKEEQRKAKGELKLKEKEAIQNRIIAQKNRSKRPKRGEFKVDVWKQEPVVEPELKSEWLTTDTVRHTLTNTGKKKKRVPKSLHEKPSVIPAVTVPHPGTSYNPLPADHRQLLAEVAADELKLMRKEKHLERVTSKMFSKVTAKQRDEDNLKEMSEGLPLPNAKPDSDEEDQDNDPNVKSINPPTKRDKKTLVQRRKQKEQRALQHQIKRQKLEKRKVADIYHLSHIGKHLSKKEKKQEMLKEKRLKLKAKKVFKPKVLSRHKFEPLEQEFLLRDEISGNLRSAQPAGNLLKDRYKSMQQRNIVAPGTVETKKLKAKVKKYIKADHKIDMKKVSKVDMKKKSKVDMKKKSKVDIKI